VKFTLRFIELNAMMTKWVETDQRVLNLDTRWMQVVSFNLLRQFSP
jgi:hypothetical protein